MSVLSYLWIPLVFKENKANTDLGEHSGLELRVREKKSNSYLTVTQSFCLA